MEAYESTPPCQYVVIRRNGNDGRKVNLDYVSTAIFGSEVDCDVRIRHDSVLPQHASVQVDEKGRIFASSFNSENPASLNGEPISKDVYIRNNDVMKIGDKSFRFEYLRTVLSPINPNTYRQATPKAKKNAGLIPKSPKTSSRTPETKKSPARVTTPRRKEPEDCTMRKSLPATPVPVPETSMVKDSTSCTNSEGCPGTPTMNSGCAQRRTPQTAPVKSMSGNRTQSYRQRRSIQTMPVSGEETNKLSPTVNSKPQECILCSATPEGKSIASITWTPQSAPAKTKPNKSTDSQKRLSWAPIQAVPVVKPPLNGGSKRLSSPSVESSSTFTPHFKSTPYPSSTECRNPTPMPTSVGDSFRSRRSSCTRSVSLLTSIQEENHVPSSPCDHIATPNKALFQDSVKTAKTKSSKRKSVTFGPQLSPEYFDKRLPSKTPIKRGSLPGSMQCSLEPQSFGIAADLPFSLGKVEEENSSSDISVQENSDNMSTMAQCSSPLPPNISMPNLGESNESSLNPSPGITSSDLDSSYCSIGELSTSCFIGEASLEDMDTKSPLPTPIERKAVKAMPTPVRKDIEKRPNLRSLRSQRHCLPTPVRRAIEDRPSLRRLVRKMDTPMRKQIRSQPKLRKTKKSMTTPLRKDIHNPPGLRKTKKSMPTPLKKDIHNPPVLRKTKKSMPTPLRKDIHNPPGLCKTKKSMPTPLKKDIHNPPVLRKTKKSMPTPLRKDIQNPPGLRKTKKSMPTPLREDIQNPPELRKTKKSMPTPLRRDIQNPPGLRKTKKSMPTPLRRDIQNPPGLRKTKKSMPTPLKKDIQNPPELRKTKKSMPTPLRKDIQNPPGLRKTKKSMPTPLKKDIQNPPELRKTKKSMPTPLREDIQNPPELRKTKKSMPTPLREDIQNPPALRKSTHLLSRKREYDNNAVDDEVCYTSAAKRRRLAPVRRNNRTQNDCYEFDGLQELFRTPQPPVKVFDPSLFLSPINRSNKVQFLSPVAKTAKKQLPREQSIPSKPIIKFASVPISDEFVFTSSNLQQTRRNTKNNTKKSAPKTKDLNDKPAPCKRTTRSSVKAANSDKVSSAPNTRSRTKREVSEEVTVPMAKRKQTQKSSVDNSSTSETAVMSTRRTRSQSKQEIPNVGETQQLRSSQSQSTSEMQPSNTRRSTRSNPSLVEPEQTIVRSGKKRSSTVKSEVTPPEVEPMAKRTRSSRKCTEETVEPKPIVRRSARLAKK